MLYALINSIDSQSNDKQILESVSSSEYIEEKSKNFTENQIKYK